MKTKQNFTTKTPLLEKACRAPKAPLLGRGWGRPLFLLLFIIGLSTANAQVGFGTTNPDASAALDLTATDKGFLPPRMDTGQRNAINVDITTAGLTIYNTDTNCLQWYNGTFWYDGCTGSGGPDPLPGNITLEPVSNYIIASANDDDYLDNTGDLPNNTTEAQLPGGTEDDVDATTGDQLIDIQGTLTTTGVTINIPYEVVTDPTTLPAFEQTITIPAEYTQGGTAAVDVKFSYPEQTSLAVGTGVVPATLQAVGSNLDVIKFDLNSGFGANYLGFLLGRFVYALDSAGTYADLEVRGMPGIRDKNFGDSVHDFIYLPITSTPTGKTWLNNNLGANYADINDTNFNPAQQATISDDTDAYGSRFQWGRDGDGHEIPGSSTDPGPVTEGNEGSAFRTNFFEPFNWLDPQNDNRWNANENAGGTVVKTANDPCPNGFRVPTQAEWQAEITSGGWSTSGAFSSDLALPVAGLRTATFGSLSFDGDLGYYWSSTVSNKDSHYLNFDSSSASMETDARAFGFSVRCLKD